MDLRAQRVADLRTTEITETAQDHATWHWGLQAQQRVAQAGLALWTALIPRLGLVGGCRCSCRLSSLPARGHWGDHCALNSPSEVVCPWRARGAPILARWCEHRLGHSKNKKKGAAGPDQDSTSPFCAKFPAAHFREARALGPGPQASAPALKSEPEIKLWSEFGPRAPFFGRRTCGLGSLWGIAPGDYKRPTMVIRVRQLKA